MTEAPVVNGLPLPPLLVALMERGRWRHPGDDRLEALIPFLREPVDFLPTAEHMRFESQGLLADYTHSAPIVHEARGSRTDGPLELPWLDVERAVFIAVNRHIGDDLGIALDYRTGARDPRVVASDWWSGDGCLWREVAPTFSQFVEALYGG